MTPKKGDILKLDFPGDKNFPAFKLFFICTRVGGNNVNGIVLHYQTNPGAELPKYAPGDTCYGGVDNVQESSFAEILKSQTNG